MNCSECRDQLVAYLEELLDPQSKGAVAEHLASCPDCREEAAEQQRLRERLVSGSESLAGASFESAIMVRISGQRVSRMRRIAMRRRYGRVGVGLAAAAALAVVLFIPWGIFSASKAAAAEVFAQAVQAVSDLQSVYLRLKMRTLPGDNFSVIDLDGDFVTVELWKRFGNPPQWRATNEGRIAVMDGVSGCCLVRDRFAYRFDYTPTFGAWVGSLMDVDRVLDTQLRLAQEQGWDLVLTHEEGVDGRPKIVVAVEATAQGDFSNDWLRNKYISASDNRRVYRFDAETRRLEDLEVWVHRDDEDELVLAVDEIVYDGELDPSLFVLAIPEDVIWSVEPEILPDNEKYAQMMPGEAAEAFFQALSNEDWDEALKFWSMSELDPRMKEHAGGLEIISIGKAFRSGQYPGWFVPYEILLRGGQTLKYNLALRNDNAAGRYIVDGGL
jgi:hypothetical protein